MSSQQATAGGTGLSLVDSVSFAVMRDVEIDEAYSQQINNPCRAL